MSLTTGYDGRSWRMKKSWRRNGLMRDRGRGFGRRVGSRRSRTFRRRGIRVRLIERVGLDEIKGWIGPRLGSSIKGENKGRWVV